jgi:hypothetical protein
VICGGVVEQTKLTKISMTKTVKQDLKMVQHQRKVISGCKNLYNVLVLQRRNLCKTYEKNG